MCLSYAMTLNKPSLRTGEDSVCDQLATENRVSSLVVVLCICARVLVKYCESVNMESVLLLSRKDRARHVLKLCECAARNLEPDLTDADDESMGLMKGSYEALASKINYLLPMASAAWRPEFEKAIDSCHSIRIETIDVSRKDAIRKVPGVCMACGRNEKNCRYSIDMAGSFSPRTWLKHPLNVLKEYAKFVDEYEEVHNDHGNRIVSECHRSKRLPSVDKGCFVVGETCLRKAKLRYSLQTLLLESCYTAERNLENMNRTVVALRPDTMYTTGEERCGEFVDAQDKLELAVADERRYAPDVVTDQDFWDIIDECRNVVSGGNEDRFNKILRDRAHETLSNVEATVRKRKARHDKECEVPCSKSYEDGSDDGEECVHRCKRTGGTRHHIQVSDEEDAESDGVVVSRGSDSVSMRYRDRARGSWDAAGSSSFAEEHGAPVECPSDSDNRETLGRTAPLSISGIVGMRRATGALSSRTDAVLRLMQLQMRLTKANKQTDAAVCTTAILTLQELMQRVQELNHTVGS